MSAVSNETTAKPKGIRGTFNWEDPFLLANDLSDEEKMVQETARNYAQDKLVPRVREAFRNEEFDREIMREMGELGLLGCTIPETYGCAGLGYVCYGLELLAVVLPLTVTQAGSSPGAARARIEAAPKAIVKRKAKTSQTTSKNQPK